jgi:parallel beta-helix repeat protein
VNVNGLVFKSEAKWSPDDDSSGCVLVGDHLNKTSIFQIEADTCTLRNLCLEIDGHKQDVMSTDTSPADPSVAICIGKESKAVIANCRITCRDGHGIDIGGNARPTISECHVANCLDGIVMRDSAAATVRDSCIIKCSSSCIKSRDSAAGSAEENTLGKSGDSCIVASGRSSTTFLRNVIGDTKGCGIMLTESTTALVEDNQLIGPKFFKIQLSLHTSLKPLSY